MQTEQFETLTETDSRGDPEEQNGLQQTINEIEQTMKKEKSEYQSAYRKWPWHPRLPSLKPGDNGDPLKDVSDVARSKLEERTTYRVDFSLSAKKFLQKAKHSSSTAVVDIQNTLYDMDVPRQKMKRMQKENAKVIHPFKDAPFRKDTNYIRSYKAFDPQTMRTSKQPPIRGKDNLEIPGTGDATGNTKSTAKSDYIAHYGSVRPQPTRPVENTVKCTDPMLDGTEYKVNYYTKTPTRVVQRKPLSMVRPIQFNEDPFKPLSTAMADFTAPENPERPKACIPPVSDHFSKDKFNATTTFEEAYQTWPVNPYKAPIWALKPVYKRPEGGMHKNSLYMHDFRNPEMILPPTPITPNAQTKYLIINPEKENIPLENVTTYTKDFRVWEGATPRESYRVIQVYTPPKEKIAGETIQRADFKGERGEKMFPCKHVSMHRDLHTDNTMAFSTTYEDTFKNPRPKTTPAQPHKTSAPTRSQSALGPIPIPSNTPPKRHNVTPESADANASARKADILQLLDCEICNKPKDECECN